VTRDPSHRFAEHVGEVELELDAPTREGLFEEAAIALGELVAPAAGAGGSCAWEVAVSAADDAALLAAWLDELVFRAESEGLLPLRAEHVTIADETARGRVTGRRGAAPHLVKGVTYHRLVVEQRGGAWHARVVLDV
jgi:SHS2 domain-containing protein